MCSQQTAEVSRARLQRVHSLHPAPRKCSVTARLCCCGLHARTEEAPCAFGSRVSLSHCLNPDAGAGGPASAMTSSCRRYRTMEHAGQALASSHHELPNPDQQYDTAGQADALQHCAPTNDLETRESAGH